MTSLQSKLRKILEISFNANLRYVLIDFTAPDVTEPPNTQHYLIQEIQYFIDNFLKFFVFNCLCRFIFLIVLI